MEYKEYMVKRKKGAKELLLSILIYIAALILSLLAVLFLPSMGGLGLLIVVGCFYGGYKLVASFNREFEYIVTEDSVDVDVIYNASRRKRLISFSMKNAEIIAPIEHEEYKFYLNRDYKEIDATTRRKDAKVYFAAVEKKGKFLVKLELPEAALLHLRKFAPSKVIMN